MKIENITKEYLVESKQPLVDENNKLLYSWNEYSKFQQTLMERFWSLSDSEIIEHMGGKVSALTNDGAFFVTPNGTIISINKALNKNNGMHHEYYFNILKYINDKSEDLPDFTPLLDVDAEDFIGLADGFDDLLESRHWIRFNFGNTNVDGRFYCVLSITNPTNGQWDAIEDFIQKGEELGKKSVLVFAGDDSHKYNYTDHTADEIVKLIRRYYASNIFYEEKESLSITEALQKLKYFN